jgi:redox-sensitive bicupin YhaK (pirin superfamily)
VPIDIRRRSGRFRTRLPWLDSSHCFSFGNWYDPANTGHGLLVVSNDDVVRPTSGFETHPHRDMEIVTWVLDGELEHRDTLGNSGAIYPGLAQRMSAGRGIWHSEKNLDQVRDVHFVQMWVLPDTESVDPSYEQLDISPQLARGGLVPVASGKGLDAAIRIRQRHATLWAGRLAPGEAAAVPDARFVHVYVARGEAALGAAGLLGPGDAARLTAADSPSLTAGSEGAEVLVWEMG